MTPPLRLYGIAARGLLLTTVCATAALRLWSPGSLTARAANGDFGAWLACAMLVASLLGWADLLWHDVGQRLIWPALSMRIRHKVCVLYYASLSACYGVFAFAAVDPSTDTSWILIADYLLVWLFGAILTAAIASEDRATGGQP